MTSDEKKNRRAQKYVSFGALGEINRKVYRFVRDGAVGTFLSSYDKTCERCKKTYFSQFFLSLKMRRISTNKARIKADKDAKGLENVGIVDASSVPRSVTERFSKAFDSGITVDMLRRLKDLVLCTPLVSYGVLVFSFALFMLISQVLHLGFSLYRVPVYLPWQNGADTVLTVTYMAVAVSLMTVSLLLIFAKEGSLYQFLSESALTGFVLRHFLGICPESVKKNVLARHNGRTFIIGMILGLTTFYVPPAKFFTILAIAIYSSVVICIPEFGLVSLTFVIPFLTLNEHPTITAILLTALTLFSSFLKVLRRKRQIRFEVSDLFVTLFLGMTFFGGVITTGGWESFGSAMVFVALGLIYFAVTLLIKNADWLKRCLDAFMMSSCIVSFTGILEWILDKQSDVWQDNRVFGALSGRVVSLWENPNVLAEYLIVAMFISFGCLVGRKKWTMKSFSFLTFVMSAACLVFTWSRGAWLAVFLTFILMLLLLSHKSIPWVVIGVIALAVSLFFLPDVFVERVFSIFTLSDSSVLYRINLWKGCAALVRRCFLTGVGVGEAAFSEAYIGFSLMGIESAPHAHNLFLQILIEQGIMGLLVFFIMLVMIVRSAFTLFRIRSFDSFTAVSSLALLSSLFALLINGMTDYIWYNNRIYLLFWIVLGLITATWRIGMDATENTNREPDSCDISFSFTGKSSYNKRTGRAKNKL